MKDSAAESKIELALRKALAENKAKQIDNLHERKFSKKCILKPNSKLFMLNNAQSQAAEEVRKLAATLFEKLPLPHKNSVLITSPVKGDGKTVISTNLSVAIAQHYAEHALLVELDLRNMGFQDVFEFPQEAKGLSHYLQGETPNASDIFYSLSEMPKLSILPAIKKTRKSAEAIHSPRMLDLFGEIKSRYSDRYIIIDSSPVLYTTDPRFLSSLVDAVILVIDLERTPKQAIEDTIATLDESKIFGIILNKVTDKSVGIAGDYYYY
ncbi:MAG: CpsD/CapB family tyrosine-protein kinase [Deltaproteobacteria bacterium]